MTRPTFLIPGASKAGTTSLHYYLSEHPQIFMSTPKELRFFDRDSNFNRGLEYYQSFFEGTAAEQLGETSPPYWYAGITFDEEGEYKWGPSDDVPARVANCYPDIKLIFTLRHPRDRAYSQYWKNLRQGRETARTFRAALEEELDGRRTPRSSPYCWIYKNRIDTHIRRWRELFPAEQMCFLVFEEWVREPVAALNEVCRFLGVEERVEWTRSETVKNPATTPRFTWLNHVVRNHLDVPVIRDLHDRLNLKRGYPPMSEELQDFCDDVFTDVITRTEQMIGKDLSVWKMPPNDRKR